MTYARRYLPATFAATLLVGLTTGYALRLAHADGIPDADVLTYAGVLEDNVGAPLSGSKNIQVNVYPDATNGATVCSSPKAIQNVVGGRFEVKMPASCVTAMKGNPNAHVEVIVDDKSLGKSRIGAVPFAIEAARAGEATGALKAQVDAKADGAGTTAALGTKAEKSTVAKVTPWVTYTATLSCDSAPITVATTTGEWRRVGDSVEIHGGTNFTGTPGNCPGHWIWSYPPGVTKPSLQRTSTGGHAGGAAIYTNGVLTICKSIARDPGILLQCTGSNGTLVRQEGAGLHKFDAASGIEFLASFPVAGWTTTTP